jgi:hypothetical protein
MTSIYDYTNVKASGVDYHLSACLEFNPQTFTVNDIEKVLAVFEGERDERDWRWVIKVTKECALKNGGRFVFLQGGCDYTGWDCQSSADSWFAKTAKQAAKFAKSNSRYDVDAYGDVYESLIKQLETGKQKTWREIKDEEYASLNLPKI